MKMILIPLKVWEMKSNPDQAVPLEIATIHIKVIVDLDQILAQRMKIVRRTKKCMMKKVTKERL